MIVAGSAPPGRRPLALAARVRRLFDLDADSVTIDEHPRAPTPSWRRSWHATRASASPGALDPEEALFRTLLGQQISIAAGNTAAGRLAADLGEEWRFAAHRRSPSAATKVLRGPARRIDTIVGAAAEDDRERCPRNSVSATPAKTSPRSSTPCPASARGPPGAILAMRVLGNPDVLLETDLVLQQSAKALGLPTHGALWAAHG